MFILFFTGFLNRYYFMKKILIIAAPTMFVVIMLFSLGAKKQPIASHVTSDNVAQLVEFSPDFHLSESNKKSLTKKIGDYFNTAIQENDIVGASVAIVKCDSILYATGYGYRNLTTKDHVDEETIFRIGSASKGFAGILAGIHVEEGFIDWEDKVIDYIPDFQLFNSEQTGLITLSHILSHSTGLPYHSFTNLIEDGIPINEIAQSFKEVELISQPGTMYSYQNAIFALSGAVIEKVTQTPLGEIIQNKIFDPLDMSRASVSFEALQLSSNVATPHREFREGWRPVPINKKYYSNAITAGGVNASATDMAKWMKFLLGNNPEVLMPITMQKVFTPQIAVEGRSKYYQKWPQHIGSSYAHGWRKHTFENENTSTVATIIHHGGSVNDYRTEIAIFPEEDLGICVLFNSPNKLSRTCIPDLYNIVQDIMENAPETSSMKESLGGL